MLYDVYFWVEGDTFPRLFMADLREETARRLAENIMLEFERVVYAGIDTDSEFDEYSDRYMKDPSS